MNAERSVEVVVGRVARPHGISGELTVRSRTDEPELRFTVDAELVAERDDVRRQVRIVAVRPHAADLLVCFDGVTTREQAAELSGALLYAAVDPRLTPVDPDEFYDHQLIGATVLTVDGRAVGTVREVLHLPLQDVLAVDALGTDATREVLVPFVAEIAVEVRLDATPVAVVIAPPPGLLDSDQPAPSAGTDTDPAEY